MNFFDIIERGDLNILLERINDKDENGQSPLHIAVKLNLFDYVTILIKNGAYVNAQDEDAITPLHVAIGGNYTDCITVLINNGADIHIKSNYENTPLDDAESDELKLLM